MKTRGLPTYRIYLLIAVIVFILISPLLFFGFVSKQQSSAYNFALAASSSDYSYHNSNPGLQVDLLNRSDTKHLFTVTDTDSKVSLVLSLDTDSIQRSASRQPDAQDNDQLLLHDILPHTDLQYHIIERGLKEDIILKDRAAITTATESGSLRFTFTLKLNDLTPVTAADGSLLPQFKDEQGRNSFYFLSPFMVDAQNTRSEAVQLTVEKGSQTDEYRVIITPDLSWLLDLNRAFPVHIDPTVVKGNAPVAEWSFDEGYGTTNYDNSGNSNDLTMNGPTWIKTDARSGTPTTYLQFDGSNDYTSLTNDSDFDFGTGSFSISVWFKHPSTQSGTDTLLARYGTAGYKLYMDSNGYICFGIDDDSTWIPDDSACTTSTQGSFADSRWHHVEAVKSGTSSITLYIDGKQVAQDASLAATATLNSPTTFYIGIDSDGASNPWTGFLDAVTVYNYARSAEQVKADALGTPQVVASFGGQTRDTLTDGLVGWWKMDEAGVDAEGEISTDYSGNANNAILYGDNGSGDNGSGMDCTAGGKFGTGCDFDGVDDYIDIGTSSIFNPVDRFTLSVWIKAGALPGGQFQRIIDRTNNGDGYALYLYGNRAYLIIGNGTTYPEVQATTTLSSDTWYHLTGTFDAGVLKIYLNGVLEATNASGGNLANIDSATQPVRLGNRGTSQYFDGSFDDVRIYNRALSPAEVQQLYNWAPGPVGYWQMDENTGTSTVNDRSGNGNTGTMNGSMTQSDWVPGKFGSALDFDGTNDVVTTASNPHSATAGTVGFWVKINKTCNPTGLAIGNNDRFYGDSGGYIHFDCLNSSNNIGLGYYDTAGKTILGTTNLPLNTWSYITATWDSTTTKLYINGIVEGSVAAGTLGSTAGNIGFGAYTSGTFSVPAVIDELRIYNYARTQSQIIEDMNGGHPVGGSPIGSQVGWWKFDEGYGDTANDSSPQGNNADFGGSATCPGAAYCPTWSTSGKYGNAVYFNGTTGADGDSHARLPNDIFDSHTEGSISVWIKPNDTGDANQILFAAAEDDNLTGSDFLEILYNSTNNLIYVVTNNNGANYSLMANTPTNSINPASWSHVIYTVNSAGHKVYINNILQSLTYTNGTAASNLWFDDISENTTAYTFGCLDPDGSDTNDCFDADGIYEGFMDEMKIYNTALTADQVALEYNRGKAAVMGATSTATDGTTPDSSQAREFCIPGDTSTCNPPVGWWKFDENTGTTNVYDSSGNNKTGTMNGSMTQSDWVPGKISSALKFDGNSSYLSIPSSSGDSLNPSSQITLQAWMKRNSTNPSGSSDFIVSRMDTSSTRTYYLGFYFDQLQMEVSENGSTSDREYDESNSTITDNEWHQVSGTFDGTTIKLYIDGQFDTQNTPTGNAIAINQNGSDVVIGRENSGPSLYFNGQIDDLRIYNYARTPAQIAWDYNRGAPVAHYKLDECTGTTIYNSVKNANGDAAGINGTLTIGATGTNTAPGSCSSGVSTEAWNNGTIGKRNASIELDGTSDYIDFGNPSQLQLASGDFTVSGWAYIKENICASEIIEKGNNILCGTATNGGWALGADGGRITFRVSDSVNVLQRNVRENVARINQWVHMTGIKKSNSIQLYVNGNYIGQSDITGLTINDTFSLRLGGRTVAWYLYGQIDDVKIYNYALTPAQVKTLYNDGAVNFSN